MCRDILHILSSIDQIGRAENNAFGTTTRDRVARNFYEFEVFIGTDTIYSSHKWWCQVWDAP
jgi:hypothetical protein